MQTIFIKEDNGKEKKIGVINKKTFFKEVKSSKHLHYKSDSWGIDYEAFKYISNQCDLIKILDIEIDKLYEITTQDFLNRSRVLHFKPHRSQLFCKRDFFKQTENYRKNKQQLKF